MCDKYLEFNFDKLFIKKRKLFNKSNPGLIKNIKKSSLKRDENFNYIYKYLNLLHKDGLKLNRTKSLNICIENLFNIFNIYNEDFNKYEDYNSYIDLFNYKPELANFSYLLYNSINTFESIFEIKTIKNNKKLKLNNKFSHEIIYIPKKKRFKYILKSLLIFKESFKNYNLWERLFWSFLPIILNKQNSFLKTRRNFIYSKSIKFFKIKKK